MIDELVHGGEHFKLPLRWNYDLKHDAAPTTKDKSSKDKSRDQKAPVTHRKLMQNTDKGLVEAKDVQNDTEYLVWSYQHADFGALCGLRLILMCAVSGSSWQSATDVQLELRYWEFGSLARTCPPCSSRSKYVK